MENNMQSHQYLLQNLYDADYYQFIKSLGNKYNISSQDLICLALKELFKIRITKTSTGYNQCAKQYTCCTLCISTALLSSTKPYNITKTYKFI